MTQQLDPEDVNGRLYKQLGVLLTRLEANDEQITTPQLINALMAIARIQVLQMTIRKEDNEPDNAGSAVRKYAQAFETNAAGRRKAGRSRAAAALAAIGPDDDAA
jgi:hypothetical protein